jgi:hypothetical protein
MIKLKFALILLLIYNIFCILPTYFVPGLFGSPNQWFYVAELFQKKFPNTKYQLHSNFSYIQSLDPIFNQSDVLIEELIKFQRRINGSSYNLVCISQGAVVCRSAIQRFRNHNCHTFISVVGPQNGQYGIPDFPFLRRLFGNRTRF